MEKTINTLVGDIYKVLEEGHEVSTRDNREEYSARGYLLWADRVEKQPEREATLRMSAMGQPCKRKLWYSVNKPEAQEGIDGKTKMKFLFGDMIEEMVLQLAIAAGHDVQGEQDTLSICGVKGHRDAVIDGITVDVKTASPFAFKKFKYGKLREDDPFGYISQLSSYVYAGHAADPENVHPTKGAFLVVDKVSGEICLDVYDFKHEVVGKQEEYMSTIEMSEKDTPPQRMADMEDGASGNRKLGMVCSYCGFKDECWPNLRTFLYKDGMGVKPRFLTKVVREPKVEEVV